jgi:PatG C-terminal/Subtilase family
VIEPSRSAMTRVVASDPRWPFLRGDPPVLLGDRTAVKKRYLMVPASNLDEKDINYSFDSHKRGAAPRIAVIDGPYSATALSTVMAKQPASLGKAYCGSRPGSACIHGTFILGLLGARKDAPIPGLCPDCELLHISFFADQDSAQANVADLAVAITDAVASGASMINLSLAILGEDHQRDETLQIALDQAEVAGAVVIAAAGNQGRLTASQILSHPVTIPVVAVDAVGNLLPDCNFGPLISRKGVAALGHQLRGYAPDGGITVMSGTSVATAVATGIVAQAWSARPNAEGDAIRAALTGLSRRKGPAPPRLGADVLLVKLDQILASRTASIRSAPQSEGSSCLKLQGGSAMHDGNGLRRFVAGAAAPSPGSGGTVAPAQGEGGCACGGASNGGCTCSNAAAARSGLVYVLGTVDCKFPDQCVSHEFQAVAETMSIEQGNDESLRTWIYRVLTAEPTEPDPEEPEPKKRGAKKLEPRKPEPKKSRPRYIARQLCWELTVEGQLAYHLALSDWQDLDDLIECLRESPDVDLVQIAGSSSMIPVEACQGEVAPVLQVAQISAYDLNDLVGWVANALQTPKGARGASEASKLALSLFDRLVQAADNFGDEDQWRALNFLAVRYKALYELYAQKVGKEGYVLDSIGVVPSRLSRQRPRERQIVDVVLSYVNAKVACAAEKYFTRVNVTCMFPFIITKLQREGGETGSFVPNYFDR